MALFFAILTRLEATFGIANMKNLRLSFCLCTHLH